MRARKLVRVINQGGKVISEQVVVDGDLPVLHPALLRGMVTEGWVIRSYPLQKEGDEGSPVALWLSEPVDWRAIADNLARSLARLPEAIRGLFDPQEGEEMTLEQALDAYVLAKMQESVEAPEEEVESHDEAG